MNANIMMDIGIIIAVAYLVSKVFQKAGIPQVVGFMLVGVLLGRSGLHLITEQMSLSLRPLVDLALGFIGSASPLAANWISPFFAEVAGRL